MSLLLCPHRKHYRCVCQLSVSYECHGTDGGGCFLLSIVHLLCRHGVTFICGSHYLQLSLSILLAFKNPKNLKRSILLQSQQFTTNNSLEVVEDFETALTIEGALFPEPVLPTRGRWWEGEADVLRPFSPTLASAKGFEHSGEISYTPPTVFWMTELSRDCANSDKIGSVSSLTDSKKFLHKRRGNERLQ